MNRVCEILGIKKPIIQAPMIWITSPELVAAVSNAGGLGVVGINCGFEKGVGTPEETEEEMRKAIRRVKELTDKPFGINILTKPIDQAGFSQATYEAAKKESVPVIIAVGPLDEAQVKEWKEAGFKVVYRDLAPNTNSAKQAEAAGVDVVVATGFDEGGNLPPVPVGTMCRTALIAPAVDVPVIAAGGIVNEVTAKATADVGAEGAYVGTRFILSAECRAAQATKDAILNTPAEDLILIVEGGGASQWRCTPNSVAEKALAANKNGDLSPSIGSFYHGMLKGEPDGGIITVSSNSSLIKSIESCETIVDELAAGYQS